MYIRQYCIRETWEEEVEKIPYASLLEHALEKRQSVVDLLHEYRPRLYTDEISLEDREKGVEFLQELNFPGAIERFLEITGQDLVDFFRLEIEWVFIQEAIDKQQIMTAGHLGWIDLGKVLKSLLAKSSSPVPVLSCNPFLGTKKAKIPAQPVEDNKEDPDRTEDEGEVLPDKGPRSLEKGKEPAGPEVEDEDLENSPHVPYLIPYLIPGPLGERPLPIQRNAIMMASQRMFPDAYKNIQGFATSTLLEQTRRPLAPPSAYCPQEIHSYAKQLLEGIVGRKMDASIDRAAVGYDLPRERSTREDMGEPSGRGQAQSRMAECSSHSPQDLGPQRHTMCHFRDAVVYDPVWFAASPSPGLESVDSNEAGRAPDYGYDHGPRDGEFIAASPGLVSNLFANPIEPVIPLHLLAKQDVPVTETAHLTQLRQVLDTKYGNIIRDKKKKKLPTGQALFTRRRASLEAEDHDDDDETEDEDAMKLPIILPEPEKDEEYDPGEKAPKRAPKKRASRNTGRKLGRPKKQTTKNDKSEKAALMKQTGDSEAQKAQSVVETAEQTGTQKHSAPELTDTITTPKKGAADDSLASNGPPSSGRIKLLVKSSRKDPTSTNSNFTQDSITVLPLNQPLTPTHTPISRVYHASSASHAIYAAVAGRARFAHTADRIAQPPGKTVALNKSYELGKLHQLSKTYESIKMGNAQDADRAEFAAKADRAEYAEKADEANYALRISRTGDQNGNA
jgi:hypothetical protein